MSYLYLTAEEVVIVGQIAFGDVQLVVRDAGLLESAVHRPSAAMFGQEAYEDLFEKAASLLQSLAVNPPFLDGNKRTAWLSCMTFLSMNGVSELRPDIDAAEQLVVSVATGQLDEVKAIAEGLRALYDQK